MLRPTNKHLSFPVSCRFAHTFHAEGCFRRFSASENFSQRGAKRRDARRRPASKKALKAPTGEPDRQEPQKQTQTLLAEFERMVDKYVRVIERCSSTAATQLTNPEHRSIAVIAIRTTNDTRPPSTNKTTTHYRSRKGNQIPHHSPQPPTHQRLPNPLRRRTPRRQRGNHHPPPPPPPDFAIIQQALHENQLLIFKGQQDLSPRAHYELTRLFGGKLRPRQVVGQEEVCCTPI